LHKSGGGMERKTVQKTLEYLKEIKGTNTFYDLHVHPFEVMHAPFEYHPSPAGKDLFSAGSAAYVPPEIENLRLSTGVDRTDKRFDHKLRAKVALLTSRRIYAHTGPKALDDLMALCAIDKALLLPVMRPDETGDGQLRTMREMFGGDERFMFGCCLPNDIPNDKITDHLKLVKDEFAVKVLKIHPAVTNIDLSNIKGIDRVEAILDASRKTGLKVIIHGGRSLDCENRHAVDYGTVYNLQHVNWSITPETVVVAHAGCYGYPVCEVQEQVLPQMERLLERHPHLVVDTSGVGFDALCHMLEHLGPRRIVFGSDAFYEKQWATFVKLWCALKSTVLNPEEDLLRIASINPDNLLRLKIDHAQNRYDRSE